MSIRRRALVVAQLPTPLGPAPDRCTQGVPCVRSIGQLECRAKGQQCGFGTRLGGHKGVGHDVARQRFRGQRLHDGISGVDAARAATLFEIRMQQRRQALGAMPRCGLQQLGLQTGQHKDKRFGGHPGQDQ